MKVLLDTNIVIHREANRVVDKDIGKLFYWLDRAGYEKCVHPITIDELKKNRNKATVDSMNVKVDSYSVIRFVAPLSEQVRLLSLKSDNGENDVNDSFLLNELYCGRVDFLITEDKKIHYKSSGLGVSDRVFNINSFLEKVSFENPGLVDYKILSVTKKYFAEIDLRDSFFDSFKEDYIGFEKWFLRKYDEVAYVTLSDGRLMSFLFLKIEGVDEVYYDIKPMFAPKKRLKIGTFKVVANGYRLGERFLKIVFDNALRYKVDEIYVTIFDKREDNKRLIGLLVDWGFVCHGKKLSQSGEELVYIRAFNPYFNLKNPKSSYPYISRNRDVYMVPIWPQYHTDLLPDSILTTESPFDYIESEPYRNAICRSYISRSIMRGIKRGDIIVFYRTAPKDVSGYYGSVITTLAICEEKIDNIRSEDEFLLRCRKRTVFSDDKLKEWWNYKPHYRPFIINFLYVYSFETGKRMNRKKMLDLGVISGEDNELRGLKKLTRSAFEIILKETSTNESLVVD